MSLMEMSFSGAVLIVVILAVRAVLKGRLPKRTFVALWIAALFRLLLPFSLPSAWSAYTFSANAAAELQNLIPGMENVFTGKMTGNELYSNASDPSLQQNTAAMEKQGQLSSFFKDTSGEMPSVTEQPSEKISVWKMIWAAGFLLCLTFFGWIYCRCCREFRMSLPVEKGILGNWQETHPLWRKLSIRRSDQIASPISYGVCRPVILLSKTVQCGDRFRLRYVLEHEYVHIQHFDAAVKLLMAAALCVHWFNPFVYLMYIFFNRDLELACDETVVRRFGEEEKSAYAMALIEMEEEKSGLLPLGNSFSKNAIEERIRAIMKMKKISPLANGLSVVLVCGIVLLSATSCGSHGESDMIVETRLQVEANEESVVGDSRKEMEDRIAALDQTIREKEEELNLAVQQKRLLEETAAEAEREEAAKKEEVRKAVEANLEESIANAVEKAQEAAEEAAKAEEEKAAAKSVEDARKGKLSIIAEALTDEAAFKAGDPDGVKSSIPEEYARFGVKLSDEKNNQWMYKGKGVAVIYDKDHWIFTNESIPEKNAVCLEVIRDKKDRVTELKEVTKKEIQKLIDEGQADR